MDEVKKIVDYFSSDDDWNNDSFLQVYEEYLNLIYWVKGFNPQNILEIGSRGFSFFILSQFSTGKKVAVDIENLEERFKMGMYNQDWRFFHGDSQTTEMRDAVKEFCPKFDLIFIDGDHSYKGVETDFNLYKELLSDRGVILFHDVDPEHIFKGDLGGGDVWEFWKNLEEGTKTHIVTTRSSGKNKLWGCTTGFGGIGIWTKK